MFESQIEELERGRAALFAEEEKLVAQLGQIKYKRQALDRAIAALQGAEEGPKVGRPKAKPKQKVYDWVPSPRILDAVLQAVRDNGESSVNAVAQAAGTAPDTARKALSVLRERELVRLSAARGQGGAALYAPMPNGH